MKILDYEISVMPWRDRWCSNACLFIAVVFTIHGAYERGWFISLRKGDSVIPSSENLVRTGPYKAKTIRSRVGPWVEFTPIDGAAKPYRLWHINFENDFVDKLERDHNEHIAFLDLYPSNTFRAVWGVEIDNKRIQTLDQSIAIYRLEANPYPTIFSGLGFLLVALFSAFRITRINNRQGD